MKQVRIDETGNVHLGPLNGEVQICDAEGNTVGYFLPAKQREKYWNERAKTLFTDEELEIARNQKGGKTTEEMLAWLNTL